MGQWRKLVFFTSLYRHLPVLFTTELANPPINKRTPQSKVALPEAVPSQSTECSRFAVRVRGVFSLSDGVFL